MPQMMPLNWLMLFMFFSTLMILFNVMNYYMTINKKFSLLSNKNKFMTMNWKW
uniref:ATP synthase F0 subunit 8 n=1 Tax=Anaxarcha zhengi TaxID=1848994 RepID=A0A172QHR6_9NEOP|nr:ATP synthase F0 subunit 8 [Anaxarcha zhengi]AND97239.1 ATP synthase F0 subunit 8 [Anaxarcha zhengi]